MRFVAFLAFAVAIALVPATEPTQVQGPGTAKGGFGGDGPGSGPEKKAPVQSTAQGPERAQDAEEEILHSAGLRTDGDALLEFFRERMRPKADLDELLVVARQLGDADAQTRAKAAAKLVARGPSAVPALRHVLNDFDNSLAAQQARRCLEWTEGQRSAELCIAAAKLLGARKPPNATETLLAFLPQADDQTVVEGVKLGLESLAGQAGAAEAALLAALSDPVPVRRGIAAAVLAIAGRAETLPEVRKLLGDPKPLVRLRAALALTQRLDEKAVGALIDLLGELSGEDRKQAETALQQLAGDWSPNPPLTGDDDLSRKIRREAWAGWWRALDGPALLASFRQRSLNKEEMAAAEALVGQLGDKTFANRERAVVQLIAMGPKVLGLIREAAKSTDLEQARRAQSCLKQITATEEKEKLPVAAPRLLAVRNPAGAAEALLAYLPFTEDTTMKEEVVKSLKSLALVGGKPDPAVIAALTDSMPIRRMAAAQALVGAGAGTDLPAIRKLLTDADPEVRLRVALALVHAQDRATVPALIDLVAELPPALAVEAEDLLNRLAGADAPARPPGDDVAARTQLRDAWQAWWKEHGAAVNLAQPETSSTITTGVTVVAEMVANMPPGVFFPPGAAVPPGLLTKGRLVALDRNGKQVWQIENLDQPIDFQMLSGDRVLIADYVSKRVTERDLKGKILWEAPNLPAAPMNVQRLANGNTFIALYGSATTGGYMLIEVDKLGKTVASFSGAGAAGLPKASNPRGAYKMPDGQMVCLAINVCMILDATGKEIKRFPLAAALRAPGGIPSQVGNIDVTAKGNIVIAQGDSVAEFDRDGKMVWQARAGGNRATRLANGNTLVASETGLVVEVDSAGKTVWQYQSPPGNQPLRARQVGNVGAVTRPAGRVEAPFRAKAVPDALTLARKASPADRLRKADIPANVLAGLGTGNNDAAKELVAVLGRPGDPQIVSLALSRDGATLAAGGIAENKAQLFDLKSGKVTKTLSVGERGNLVAISPDGASVAMSGDRPTAQVVDAATGNLKTTIASSMGFATILDLVFSPDGKTVGLGDNASMVVLHDLQNGKSRTLAGHSASVTKLSFSQDGKFLASAGGQIVRDVMIWETASGKILGRLQGHTNSVFGLAWHPKGKMLATGSLDGSIRLWDLDTMTQTQLLMGNGSEIHSLAWHPSGDLLAANEHSNGTITLWDTKDKPPRSRVIRLFAPGPASRVASRHNNDILFTPEGRHLIAGNSDGTISVLRLAEVGASPK